MFNRYLRFFFYLFLFLLSLSVDIVNAQENTKSFSELADENPPVYNAESVLKTGNWYKLSIIESGIYKIDYEALVKMGVEPASIDPRKIGIYFNGNGILPEDNGHVRHDDLFENDIFVSGQADGIFNSDDYILFYGSSATKWKHNVFSSRFEHEINPYSDTSFYFICLNQISAGKRISTKAQSSLQPTKYFNQFLDYQYHENDSINLMLSGRQWYGEEFSIGDANKQFNFIFPDLVKERKAYLRFELVARSIAEDVYCIVKANGETLYDSIKFARLSADSQIHGRETNKNAEFESETDNINISIPFIAQDGSSRAWLNYLRLNAWRWLIYHNKPLFFRNPESVGNSAVSTFSIANAPAFLRLWDITNPLKPVDQQFSLQSDSLKFTIETDTLHEYILIDDKDFKQFVTAQKIPNQNLHLLSSCDMLIITDMQFISEANEIKNIHWEEDALECIVVDIEQIYNEFGCGSPDITALRDFIRMVYNKSEKNLKYVLLFGDASYDYRDRITGNTNFVPTYQSTSSLIDTRSFLSDDYFGLMDFTEGEDMIGSLDLGIGRLPVSNSEDARVVVNKIKQYIASGNDNTGEWRNNITFVADDGNGNLHLDQAETLSKQIDTARFEMNVGKIYTDAYKRVSVTGGFRFPDANKALHEDIEEGSLIINYTGHGGITGLTDEKLFTIADISSLTNAEKMPFFITATCEFSRFDNPKFVSAGERLLMQPNGGAIAMMTTTRVAFSHSNFALNRKLYYAIFDRADVEFKRLGDIIRLAKTPANENINNFTLLGDPALRLNYPSKNIITTKFNGQIPISAADTVHAMSGIAVEGKIVDYEGVEVIDFNGYLDIKMFDKKTTYRTLANDQSSNAVNFNYFNKLLYKGRVSVVNGVFKANFLLPKDLSFNYGNAKISYYAFDTTTYDDATGAYSNLMVGGIDETVAVDENGPEIEMYLNKGDFVSGDTILPDPLLFARITDPQGVNYLGTSIGRDIILTINNQTADEVNLNSYFQPDIDNFSSGSLVFDLSELPLGSYTLEIKAWDLHNNSSIKSIEFVIATNSDLSVAQVFNYPNPFKDETAFTFHHNQQDGLFDVEIEVFTISGDWVTTLAARVESVASQSLPVYWNGKDHNGQPIDSGTYVYRMLITDNEGRRSEVNQRFVIVR
jgi:hypothetical protein